MAITPQQTSHQGSSGVTSIAVSYHTAVTPGNLLVALLNFSATDSPDMTITDTAGATWTKLFHEGTGPTVTYAARIATTADQALGNLNLEVTLASAAVTSQTMAITLWELQGADTTGSMYDAAASSVSTGSGATSAPIGPGSAPAAQGSFAIASVALSASGGTSAVAWTNGFSDASSESRFYRATKSQPTSATAYSTTAGPWPTARQFNAALAVFSPSTNNPPNAPSLSSPANGTTVPTNQNVTFSWSFSDPDPGDTQSAWQLVITV